MQSLVQEIAAERKKTGILIDTHSLRVEGSHVKSQMSYLENELQKVVGDTSGIKGDLSSLIWGDEQLWGEIGWPGKQAKGNNLHILGISGLEGKDAITYLQKSLQASSG